MHATTPIGCLMRQDALVGQVPRIMVAVDALGFLAEPLEERGRVERPRPRLGERLSLLHGHQRARSSWCSTTRSNHCCSTAARPSRSSCATPDSAASAAVDGRTRFGRAELRHGADHFARGRVVHRQSPPDAGLRPGAVDVTRLRRAPRPSGHWESKMSWPHCRAPSFGRPDAGVAMRRAQPGRIGPASSAVLASIVAAVHGDARPVDVAWPGQTPGTPRRRSPLHRAPALLTRCPSTRGTWPRGTARRSALEAPWISPGLARPRWR